MPAADSWNASMSTSAPSPLPALGICLEEYEYPYSVQFLPLTSDLQPVTMAYGDDYRTGIPPTRPRPANCIAAPQRIRPALPP